MAHHPSAGACMLADQLTELIQAVISDAKSNDCADAVTLNKLKADFAATLDVLFSRYGSLDPLHAADHLVDAAYSSAEKE